MNDKTITMYNYHKNSDKTETWSRTVIRGVEYSYKSEKTVSSDGKLVFTPLLTVVIPIEADTDGKEYIDSVNFLKLLDKDVDKYFTFNPVGNKDMIVAGECEKEITSDYKITDLKKDFQKCGTISSFSDNTDGELLKHYKVVCK